MVMEPKAIVDKIINYIKKRGVVAGGAVRDIVLGRIPKDYDVFIFGLEDFHHIIKIKGIFDRIPTETENPFASKYPSMFEVYNTTLSGNPVQIIWNPNYLGTGSKSWWSRYSDTLTGEEVVGGFDFTINMMYVDSKKQYHITDEAETALKKRLIVFNKNHSSALAGPMASVNHLFRRMVYLADKLGFTIDSKAVDNIYKKYTPYDKEMEALVLKEDILDEAINALF